MRVRGRGSRRARLTGEEREREKKKKKEGKEGERRSAVKNENTRYLSTNLIRRGSTEASFATSKKAVRYRRSQR